MKRLLALVAALLVLPASGSVAVTTHHHHHHRAVHHKATADNSVRVWVNTNSGVYHYPGERWYGNTQEGEFMTEKQAIARGYRATENGQ